MRKENPVQKKQKTTRIKPAADQQSHASAPPIVDDGLQEMANSTTVEAMSSLLVDTRIPKVQRQALASRIGRMQGNQYLQRVIQREVDPAFQPLWSKIEPVLKLIPGGNEALDQFTTLKIKLRGNAGGGSYFDGSTSTITLDTQGLTNPDGTTNDVGIKNAALVFVHEMNHAKYSKEGKSADIKTLSRDQYIEKMLEEEAEGTVKSIEAKIEMEGVPSLDVTGVGFPLEKEYRQEYQKAVTAAQAQNLSPDEVKKKGREAGKLAVLNGFKTGAVVASTTGQTYAQLYGSFWDQAHPAGSP